ncbi:MAG: hypothetical protein ACUVQF_03585 [Fervidobacterium sp.]|uniref:hypothetical protein n=1 Tax=Fervidobacterium sp. TaxID=1871331 RepID=UPI00404B8971
MTLVRSKRREEALEGLRQERRVLATLKLVLPWVLLLSLIVVTYALNVKTAELSRQVEMYRKNLGVLEEQTEALDVQISKLILGRDVVN